MSVAIYIHLVGRFLIFQSPTFWIYLLTAIMQSNTLSIIKYNVAACLQRQELSSNSGLVFARQRPVSQTLVFLLQAGLSPAMIGTAGLLQRQWSAQNVRGMLLLGACHQLTCKPPPQRLDTFWADWMLEARRGSNTVQWINDHALKHL